MPAALGRVLAPIYGAAIAWRNRRFDAGRGVVTLDRPVISVGNLSVGGTGKSPMVAVVVGWLREAGMKPCVAMRGYGAPRGGRSDEAMDYASTMPGVPVVARPDRVEGLLELFATPEGEDVDVVVLDDGFQHRRIARQLDIVLIDATRTAWEDALLPLGWLREPVASLGRAGAVVLTHADRVSAGVLAGCVARAKGAAPGAIVASARHEWDGVDVHEGGVARREGVEFLRGRKVFAACAVGNPASFLEGVARAGANVAGTMVLRDHDPYDAATIARLREAVRASGAETLVMTSKDWVKVARSSWACAVVVPRLRVGFVDGEASLREAVLTAAAHTAE